ncbi:MAG: NAD-dependent epimerase/dehydratase family protein [Myxococcales bacterium]
MRLLILGSTGLVGGHLLRRALADPRVTGVIAPTRRPLAPHPKLSNPVAEKLEALLPEAAAWSVDSVVCALGTTLEKAGSREAFRHVDHDLPLELARIARRQGAQTFALISSRGASPTSAFFYLRTKGELERDAASLGFASVFVARPGFISGDRGTSRPAEQLARGLLRSLGPLLPRGARPNEAMRIAEVVLEAAVAPSPGLHVAASTAFL